MIGLVKAPLFRRNSLPDAEGRWCYECKVHEPHTFQDGEILHEGRVDLKVRRTRVGLQVRLKGRREHVLRKQGEGRVKLHKPVFWSSTEGVFLNDDKIYYSFSYSNSGQSFRTISQLTFVRVEYHRVVEMSGWFYYLFETDLVKGSLRFMREEEKGSFWG